MRINLIFYRNLQFLNVLVALTSGISSPSSRVLDVLSVGFIRFGLYLLKKEKKFVLEKPFSSVVLFRQR